jgi:hypothetical protein
MRGDFFGESGRGGNQRKKNPIRGERTGQKAVKMMFQQDTDFMHGSQQKRNTIYANSF